MLPLLCSMSLISPNFAVSYVDHFFPILARGLFRKLLEKALITHFYLKPMYSTFYFRMQLL